MDIRKAPAQQRLHDDGRDTALLQFAVQVLGIGIARVDLLGVFPVHVVELYLHEVPLVAVVLRKQVVEHRDVPVVGEPEVADTAGLTLGKQEIQHPVVDVAGFELLHAAAHAHAVQQQVVDIIDLQLAERIAVHGHRGFAAPGRGREIGQFGGNKIFVTRVAA